MSHILNFNYPTHFIRILSDSVALIMIDAQLQVCNCAGD